MDGFTTFRWAGFGVSRINQVVIGFGMMPGRVGGGVQRMHFHGFIVTIPKDGFTLT
jgi:hypothetical protein